MFLIGERGLFEVPGMYQFSEPVHQPVPDRRSDHGWCSPMKCIELTITLKDGKSINARIDCPPNIKLHQAVHRVSLGVIELIEAEIIEAFSIRLEGLK